MVFIKWFTSLNIWNRIITIDNINIANTSDHLNKGDSNKSPSKNKKDINNNTAFYRKI